MVTLFPNCVSERVHCRCAIILPSLRVITAFNRLVISLQWLVAVCASSVQAFAFRLVEFSGMRQCVVINESDSDVLFQRAYSVAHCIVCYAVPSVTIVVTQTVLYKHLHVTPSQSQSQPQTAAFSTLADSPCFVAGVVHSVREARVDSRFTQDTRYSTLPTTPPRQRAAGSRVAAIKRTCVSGARKAALRVSVLTGMYEYAQASSSVCFIETYNPTRSRTEPNQRIPFGLFRHKIFPFRFFFFNRFCSDTRHDYFTLISFSVSKVHLLLLNLGLLPFEKRKFGKNFSP